MHDIITFKADHALSEAMAGIPNRSEFIRSAVLAALKNACPLCCGTGVLTPQQHRHWTAFAEHHAIEQCHDCQAVHLVCKGSGNRPSKRPLSRKSKS